MQKLKQLMSFIIGKNYNVERQMELGPNPEKIDDLVFYSNRGLWCEVRPNMRQVSVEYIPKEKKLVLYLFYDKPLTQEEEDYDVAWTILDEAFSDFTDPELIWEEEIIVVPYPQNLPQKGIPIFRRYETISSEESWRNLVEPLPNLESVKAHIFYLNKALLGEVRPGMRKVSFEYIKQEKRFILYLFYNNPLTPEEEDYDVSGSILAKIRSNFPDPEVTWESRVIIVTYPEWLPQQGKCIFRRYEPAPPGESLQNG